ncbi:hypothetical protein BP6252_10041 [Coleophoma cylindrospora]|uniref:DUF1989 domain-containing protein n=1 Tax=Coleophoma cylindrospora TaxID=1849047 RepID=A0A3D8QX95_9HELO|nr:hypothetical protein BP6252_10041 [Coleophoma cylindrospora]
MASSQRIPTPAYPAEDAAILFGDQALYARVIEAAAVENQAGKKLIEEFEIPIRSGKAWVVKKGQICTLTTPYGPQVGDLNIWALGNPRERFWAARTRQLHASHVSVGDRLWSNLPFLRPLATIVGDSLKDYGVDEVGGRVHDLLGTREACPAKPGDYFTFLAETDLLCAMSTCPGGDLSVYGWGEDAAKRMLDTCRPLGVAVYEFVEREKVLEGWEESKRPGYQGFHGLNFPVFGQQT